MFIYYIFAIKSIENVVSLFSFKTGSSISQASWKLCMWPSLWDMVLKKNHHPWPINHGVTRQCPGEIPCDSILKLFQWLKNKWRGDPQRKELKKRKDSGWDQVAEILCILTIVSSCQQNDLKRSDFREELTQEKLHNNTHFSKVPTFPI